MLTPIETGRRAVGSRVLLLLLGAACVLSGLVVWSSYDHAPASIGAPSHALYVPPAGLPSVTTPGSRTAPAVAPAMMPATMDSLGAQPPFGQPAMDTSLQSLPSAVAPRETAAAMGPLPILFCGLAAGIAIGVTITKQWLAGVGGQHPLKATLHGAEDNLELGVLPGRAGVPTMSAAADGQEKRSAAIAAASAVAPSRVPVPTMQAAVLDPVDTKCINTIRCLSADMVEAANSGHPGAPMGCAPMAHILYGKQMNHNPTDPEWFNRDRFVLSNGHACALQYSMLHLTGYPLSLDDCKKFRQIDSLTPGHPENFVTAGVEVSTGPLGQGLSNAVGLALAESQLAATFNKPGHEIIDHYTYCILGDGCLQEGVTSEACSLAGHLGLGKLIALYDDNKITIDGDTDLSFTEDVKMRYESYGWQVLELPDGTDANAINAAIDVAKACTDKPTLIKIRTVIGEGCPSKAGSHTVHGAPLGKDALAEMKTNLGMPQESFHIPGEVTKYYSTVKAGGEAKHAEWSKALDAYCAAFPDEGAELKRRIAGELPAGWEKSFPANTPTDKGPATRQHSQDCIKALGTAVPEFVGGSADLTPSNLTNPGGFLADYQKDSPMGRYIRFGIREHGMVAICNGLAAHGGLIPYCATFFNFAGYALGAMRVTALSQFRVIFVMTHDSIGLGEDGPTHQPVEMLESFRAMPNMYVFRPCDGNEVAGSYACAVAKADAPSLLALSRQGMPNYEGSSVEAVTKGAYVIEAAKDKPELVIVATGSEVQYAAEAKAAMGDVQVSVVSMPCQELFEEQSKEYQLSVFPEGVPVLSVEAAGVRGWEKYAHLSVGMTRFGASGPIDTLYSKFGITTENIVTQAKGLLAFYDGKPAPSKINGPVNSFKVPAGHH